MLKALTRLLQILTDYYAILTLERRAEVARKIAYDAIAYAEEKKALRPEMDGETYDTLAIGYMTTRLPGIDQTTAMEELQSIVAKIPGCGATGQRKV